MGKIVGMISVHDNPYIGIPVQGKDRLALRDCDRIWVMPTYHLTRERVKRQFEQRIQELESDLLSDEDRFGKYLSEYLSIQVDET